MCVASNQPNHMLMRRDRHIYAIHTLKFDVFKALKGYGCSELFLGFTVVLGLVVNHFTVFIFRLFWVWRLNNKMRILCTKTYKYLTSYRWVDIKAVELLLDHFGSGRKIYLKLHIQLWQLRSSPGNIEWYPSMSFQNRKALTIMVVNLWTEGNISPVP